MYVIKEGEVLVSAVSAAGEGSKKKKHVYSLGVIGRGQWFGERSLLTGEKMDFTYITSSRVVAFAITPKLFAHVRRFAFHSLVSELALKIQYR